MAHCGTSKRNSVWLGLVLFLLLVWGASVAQASLISFDMGIEFSGAWPPEGAAPWLNATFEDSGVDEVTLTLSTLNLTDTESVWLWMFNLDPSYDPRDLGFSLSGSTGAFTTPTVYTGDTIDGKNSYHADGDGYFDVKIEFDHTDGPPKRFGDGDGAVFTINGIGGLTAESFDFISELGGGAGQYKTAAHVQSIGPTDDGSGWVSTPEPATLAVLAVGLLVGLLRKRRA